MSVPVNVPINVPVNVPVRASLAVKGGRFTCATRRRLGTTLANGLWREALLRAPDLSLRDGRVVKPHPPARDHSQFL